MYSEREIHQGGHFQNLFLVAVNMLGSPAICDNMDKGHRAK